MMPFTNKIAHFFQAELLLLVTIFLLVPTTDIKAKEVQLHPGESYSEGDLTVICQDATSDSGTIQLKECQYWDDFKKICLFEKTIFIYKNLQCVEECQHWDDFNNLCYYQTRCVFYPEQKSFVRTDCAEFDTFSNKCLKTNEKIVNGPGRKSR